MSTGPAESPKKPYALHWFRRDLRVAGNEALRHAHTSFAGRVLGFFCFDSAFLARPDFSPDRFAFFLATLEELKRELRELGGDLLVLDVGPDEAFSRLFAALRKERAELPKLVTFNRDYEPFARRRDEKIPALLSAEFGVECRTERDHLVIEPHELSKPGAERETYKVFTPFSRRWADIFETDEVRARISRQKKAFDYLAARSSGKIEPIFALTWKELLGKWPGENDALAIHERRNSKLVRVPIPPAGSLAAFDQLKSFAARKIERYTAARDVPGVDGTSRLSIYFKNGSLTTSMVMAWLRYEEVDFKDTDGPTVFLKELVWREFYYHILFHHPRVETEAFITSFKNLEWENDEEKFERWKNGETGFPIVDAGMRQLASTGWMHNRMRMIAASFLTKDLLIDWRWGERYFMERLLDGDLAPNNGGWQWAASTGCDPQPYFRIFNPKLQSEKFDPDGDYIRAFVPELKTLKPREIHEPSAASRPRSYPEPIVDHREQKSRALKLYSDVS